LKSVKSIGIVQVDRSSS